MRIYTGQARDGSWVAASYMSASWKDGPAGDLPTVYKLSAEEDSWDRAAWRLLERLVSVAVGVVASGGEPSPGLADGFRVVRCEPDGEQTGADVAIRARNEELALSGLLGPTGR